MKILKFIIIKLRPLSLLFVLSVVFSMQSLVAYGQGKIEGVITDKAEKLPLIACNIIVKGTTFGTLTDYNGGYILPLEAGTYTLQISYIGYETLEKTVTVEDNKTVEVNAELIATSIIGEEVIVTMQARGQLAAVNQQLRSNQIVNVVSAERIRELPDENAAQAISRLPGVHLDGSKVVIRGVESKMNKILINGIEIPSTEGLTRATDLGMISANMLSGIEVFKTLTPDMDADAIGGVVNLRFREAPKGFYYSVTAQGAYNQQEKNLEKSVFWGNISNRFFNNRMGLIMNLNYENRHEGTDRIKVAYSELGSGAIGEAVYMLSRLNVFDEIKNTDIINGSLVVDFDIQNGQFVYSGMMSHSTPERTVHEDYMNIGANYHHIILERSKNTSFLLNNSLRYEQQIGITRLDASISNVSLDRKDVFNYEFSFQQSQIPAFVDSMLTHSKRLKMEPWEIYDAMYPGAMETERVLEGEISPTNYDEHQWLADLNMQIPVRISDDINIKFKLGGKYKNMKRNYDTDAYSYVGNNFESVNATIQPWLTSIGHEEDEGNLYFRDFRDYNYQPNEGFMNKSDHYNMNYVIDVNLADEMFLKQIDPEVLQTNVLMVRDDYWGGEELYAGYLMAEINLGKKLTIIPGARYEQANNNYKALKVEEGTLQSWRESDTLSRPAQHKHWLPHLHLRFRVTDWWDIRFSYNNTLSRPDYNHAVPKVNYHTLRGIGKAGNPYIRPAVSENLDANFTFYSRKLGLVTIGGFMKTIKDVFYMQPTILKNIPDSSILAEFPLDVWPSLAEGETEFFVNSPYPAYVKGIETEWQSNFSWLPVPFNGIVLNANYTHVWSETKYMQHRVLYQQVPGSFLPQPVEVDTFYVNRLLSQADDLANISLGYDYKNFSARLSFRFQGNVISNIGTRPEENGYTNNIYAYDFVAKQSIPVKFGDIEVFFNAINLTNVPKKGYSIYPNKGETNTSALYSGRQFQLGLRFKY